MHTEKVPIITIQVQKKIQRSKTMIQRTQIRQNNQDDYAEDKTQDKTHDKIQDKTHDKIHEKTQDKTQDKHRIKHTIKHRPVASGCQPSKV